VSHQTQIYGPVHGATTHENSTTMSLYGYDQTYYMVESSLGVPIGCVGRVDSLQIRLVGNMWVREWTLLSTIWHKRGVKPTFYKNKILST
jgi:hypothetical protein